jgi:hypothetical protein
MPCTREHKLRQLRNVARTLTISLVLAGVALAQAPVVPISHYGPPDCGVTRSPAKRPDVAAARAEQEAGASDGSALLSDEPMQNFGIERYKLQDYGDCVGQGGCYWADLDAQFQRADAALALKVAQERQHRKDGTRLALVMDIDDTTLSSYCEMKAESFGYIAPMFDAWVVSPQAAVAIPGALRLFRDAKAQNIAVFFITGRPGKQIAGSPHAPADETSATKRNLQAAGFAGWSGLALRDGAENGMATIAYKSRERQKIVAMHYKILMSVGDQWSDLLGTPGAEISVKLPNPFYFIP